MSRRPVGSVSPSVMPIAPGCCRVLVSVKTSVVAAASLIEAAPKVLATFGFVRFTTRHWSVELLVMPVVVTEAARLVKPAGLPTQLAFTCPPWFVRPTTVTVQLAVPAVIAETREARRALGCRPL